MPRNGQSRRGNDVSATIASMIPEAAPLDMPPEVDAQQQRLAAVQAQLEQHPYINWGMRLPSLKRRTRSIQLQAEIAEQAQLISSPNATGRNFNTN